MPLIIVKEAPEDLRISMNSSFPTQNINVLFKGKYYVFIIIDF